MNITTHEESTITILPYWSSPKPVILYITKQTSKSVVFPVFEVKHFFSQRCNRSNFHFHFQASLTRLFLVLGESCSQYLWEPETVHMFKPIAVVRREMEVLSRVLKQWEGIEL
jgi:hypothetical protein